MRMIDVLSEYMSDMSGLRHKLRALDEEEGKRHITHYLPHGVYFECGCYYNKETHGFSECELHKLMEILDMARGKMETIKEFNVREGMSEEYIEANRG